MMSDYVARLRLDQVVAVRTVARRNWSARCEGRTVAVWTVRGADQRAATRGRSRYDPDDETARPQRAC